MASRYGTKFMTRAAVIRLLNKRKYADVTRRKRRKPLARKRAGKAR